jgi:hypothetical protein
MRFGEAITLLNAGHPVTRQGWNGNGMFLIRAGGYKVEADKVKPNDPINAEFLKNRGLTHLEILPHIDMWTINSEGRQAYLPGWLASQSDMLADDWMIYKDAEYQPISKAGLLNEAQNQLNNELRKLADKKLHWTQTAKGRKIMANRKPRGKTK